MSDDDTPIYRQLIERLRMRPEQPRHAIRVTGAETLAAPPESYRHRDPITDPAWPTITAPDGELPDQFPLHWGSELTERDAAAVDAASLPRRGATVPPINLTDYSRTAAQRGWGAGWPGCSGAKGQLAIVQAKRSGVRVSVHQRIARLVQMLFDATEAHGYLLRTGVTGAYNCRAIAGTTVSSNHAWGLAVDINWDRNPYTTPRRTDMPAWMPALWNRYGFAWGGNYTGKQDSMHYEFMGSPAQADAATARALAELGGGATSPVTPAPGPATPTPATSLEDPMIVFDWPAGAGAHKLVCPVGKASQVTAAAWLSLACDGVISHYDIWFQSDSGGLSEAHGQLAKDRRGNWTVPDGTTQIVVHYVATGPVGATLEVKPK